MWTRAQLKAAAKQNLRQTYWTGFGAYAVPNILSGIAVGIVYGVFYVAVIAMALTLPANPTAAQIAPLITVAVFAFAAVMALLFLLVLPLSMGIYHYFNRAASGRVEFRNVFFSFSGGRYTGVTGGMALRTVYVLLWSLLLIVPGIVKSYSYFAVPFLLSDNPNIGARRAIELSRQMMHGQKWRVFVLSLSFLGWLLLGMLLCGFGTYFISPYILATYAELYQKLRADAVYGGLTTPEELALLPASAISAAAPDGQPAL